MIDQDYTELLGRSPPSGEVLEWTFSARLLANAFASLFVGTPALCLALYSLGILWGQEDDTRDGAELRIPTMTRLSMQSPTGEVFAAGMHLAAVMALALFWCVRLSHHQRLQARTGVARYDLAAEGAIRWVTAAWAMGALGAVSLFVGASVPGDRAASFSAQGIAHLAFFVAAAAGMLGQAMCTAWVLRKARPVFVVSEADRVSYRRKMQLVALMVVTVAAAISSVLLLERLVDDASAGDGSAHSSSHRTMSSIGGSILGSNSSGGGAAVLTAEQGGVGSSGSSSGGGGGGSGDGGNDTGGSDTGLSGASISTGGGRDCDHEWCYSRSVLGLWEWVLMLLEAGFCLALRHDLSLTTGGVGVESFVL